MIRQPRIRHIAIHAAGLLALTLCCCTALAQPGRGDLVVAGRDGWLFPAWETTDRVYRDAYHNHLDLMARGVHILQGAGVRVIVGILPAKARVYPEYLPPGTQVSRDFTELYAEIDGRLKAQRIETMDMATPLLAGKGEHPMFARTDSHWTAYGADRVARAVGERLRPGLASLAGKAPDGKLPGFAPWTILGDLARLTDEPVNEEVWIRVKSRRGTLLDDYAFGAEDGADMDTREPELALVCTSYCEPGLGFPLVFSHTVGKPVDLYWRNANLGHWKILSDYLQSRLRRHAFAPRVLVWLVMEGGLGSGPNDESWRSAGGSMEPEAWLRSLEETVRALNGNAGGSRP